MAPMAAQWKRRRRLPLLSLFAASLALLPTCAADLFPWSTGRRWKAEGLIDVGSLGLDTMDGMVAAVGDSDGDQLLDLFVLSKDQRRVTLWLWDRTAYAFHPSPAAAIEAPSDFVITNVVPGDYNYDGRLDVLLMGQSSPGSWSSSELKMVVYFGIGDGAFSSAHAVPSSALAQPLVIDADGDMRVDLLGMSNEGTPKPRLWQNVWSNAPNATDTIFALKDAPLAVSSFNCKMPDPHSNAFVDLNGDCLADLFLTCIDPTDSSRLMYQIWLNSKSDGFSLARSGSLPPGTGQITFADVDRDGTIDLVFVACPNSGGDCALHVAYNKQMPLCTGNPRQVGACRDPGQLCRADPDFKFDLSFGDDNDAFTRLALSDLIPNAPYMVRNDNAFSGSLPNSVRIGDYNQDGYPDLLLITSATRNAPYGAVTLLESYGCDAWCTPAARSAGRRVFRSVTGGVDALAYISDARSVAFLDIDEDGSLDILVQRSGKAGGASRTATFVKNNYYHDAFFLKALVVNGACEGYCSPNQAGQQRYHPYGVSYSGASFKFTVLDPSGVRRATQVGQLPQTSYLNLLTPYSYFGLGRTNNYVEALFVGSTRHQAKHYATFEGLIPNSQVVIVPWQASGSDTPSSWTRRLFLHPGDWIPWVTVAILGSLLVLGIVVLVLHLNEKAIDAQERRRQMVHLNFDALG